jgi:iron(III) transport system permease protein
MLDAGKVLGSRGLDLFFRVDLPTLTPALLAAGTLVFVEIIKELPATLLLRPLGVETLATLVYAKANAALFAEAALPALAIVLAGIVPVILATQLGGRRNR